LQHSNFDIVYTGPALAGAGPNARPKRGAPLNSGFMMPSFYDAMMPSVNRVMTMVEHRYKALTRELSTFANVR